MKKNCILVVGLLYLLSFKAYCQPVYDTPAIGSLIFESKLDLIDFQKSEEEKVSNAITLIKLVIASNEFKKRVVAFQYQNKREYVQNNGLTNVEIYNHIVSGEETLSPSTDFMMNLEIEIWRPRFPTSTIGYTYPDVPRIWIKKSFFQSASIPAIAGNLFHEWIHKLGFEHDLKPTARRPSTVPYAVGDIMQELAQKISLKRKLGYTPEDFEIHCFHHSKKQ